VLVIGGTMFIGQALVKQLLHAGHDVTVLHRKPRHKLGKRVGNVVADRNDPETGEIRWHAIGAVRDELGIVAVLLVVHVYREERNGEEIIRIISARAAEKHELRRYKEQKID